MKKNKKVKIKGCACYGVNSIHPCFCSPFSNKDKKPLKQADVIRICPTCGHIKCLCRTPLGNFV